MTHTHTVLACLRAFFTLQFDRHGSEKPRFGTALSRAPNETSVCAFCLAAESGDHVRHIALALPQTKAALTAPLNGARLAKAVTGCERTETSTIDQGRTSKSPAYRLDVHLMLMRPRDRAPGWPEGGSDARRPSAATCGPCPTLASAPAAKE